VKCKNSKNKKRREKVPERHLPGRAKRVSETAAEGIAKQAKNNERERKMERERVQYIMCNDSWRILWERERERERENHFSIQT